MNLSLENDNTMYLHFIWFMGIARLIYKWCFTMYCIRIEGRLWIVWIMYCFYLIFDTCSYVALTVSGKYHNKEKPLERQTSHRLSYGVQSLLASFLLKIYMPLDIETTSLSTEQARFQCSLVSIFSLEFHLLTRSELYGMSQFSHLKRHRK